MFIRDTVLYRFMHCISIQLVFFFLEIKDIKCFLKKKKMDVLSWKQYLTSIILLQFYIFVRVLALFGPNLLTVSRVELMNLIGRTVKRPEAT